MSLTFDENIFGFRIKFENLQKNCCLIVFQVLNLQKLTYDHAACRRKIADFPFWLPCNLQIFHAVAQSHCCKTIETSPLARRGFCWI
jgi:hypothetical protein